MKLWDLPLLPDPNVLPTPAYCGICVTAIVRFRQFTLCSVEAGILLFCYRLTNFGREGIRDVGLLPN